MPLTADLVLRAAIVTAMVLTAATATAADELEKRVPSDKTEMKLNIPTWTLGGKQFWTDTLIHGRWRIQRHVRSRHYRLLDPSNVRRAWGPWDDCLAVWADLKKEKKVAPLSKKVVIVLHGLGRTRSSMKGLARYLADHGDYSVLNFSYASTRSPLADDARCLAQVVSHLEGVEEVNFVAHSMGNLVVRHFLADQFVAARGLDVDQRIGRFVMLAPPNNGAALAKRFKSNPVFHVIFGTGGQQFTKNWESLQGHLITPPCQFGIIAGGSTDGDGSNPLLEGDDDLVVTVRETRLIGARDFVVLPARHTFIMDDATVQQYTLRFLQHGYFISEDRRQPITAEEVVEEQQP